MARSLFSIFLLVAACAYTAAFQGQRILSTLPYGCTAVRGNFCKAVCGSGVTLDISDIFKYSALTTRGDYYDFVYNPCRGNVCDFVKRDNFTAICQVDVISTFHQNYTCGRVDSAEWTILQTNPYIFRVVYKSNNITGVRTSIVTFYEDPSRLDTQFKYISQYPKYTYNFEVRGSFVGQPKNPRNTCKVDDTHCRAVCGGDVVLDISGVFKNDIVSARGDYYKYVYSPCKGEYCAYYSDGPTTAMCQFDLSPPNKNFSCGRVGFTEWTLQQRDPYIFTVVYNYSSPINYSRRTTVTFREDPTRSKTKFKYLSQYPVNTYNFEVIGKYVGQPAKNTDKLCTVDESNHCVATCDGRKFDISKVFEYPVTSTVGRYIYSYSPCDGGSMCGWTQASAVCQSSSDYSYSVGSENSVMWWLNQSEPYYVFTIEYKQGDGGRIGRVTYIEYKNMTSSIFGVTREPQSSEPLNYEFEVRGSNIGQPRGCTSYTTQTQLIGLAPGVPLVIVCVVVLLLLILTGTAAGLSGRCYARRKVFQDVPLLK